VLCLSSGVNNELHEVALVLTQEDAHEGLASILSLWHSVRIATLLAAWLRTELV
jgi:hypothetical protein